MVQTDENLNYNLEKVMEIYRREFSHSELIGVLENGSAAQKQAAILQLDSVCSVGEAWLLVSNLTGQDAKIREAVAFKIKEFMPQCMQYFTAHDIYDIFLDAVIDINGNVCRSVICAICNLKDNNDFMVYFCPKLASMTLALTEIISKFDFQEGKYKVNKEIFKLYWCLEVVYELFDGMPSGILEDILLKTKSINEYTIREKTAKILTRTNISSNLLEVKQELKNDPNYYVRRF
jgi:hypothetical protein